MSEQHRVYIDVTIINYEMDDITIAFGDEEPEEIDLGVAQWVHHHIMNNLHGVYHMESYNRLPVDGGDLITTEYLIPTT